jgi:hypothetical protein
MATNLSQTTLNMLRMMQLAPLRKTIVPRRCKRCKRIRFFAYLNYCHSCVDETLERLDAETQHLIPASYALSE